MRFAFAIQIISMLLMFQPDSSLTCDQADWQASLDQANTWSTCPKRNTYLKGLWRNDRQSGDERVGRIEYGRCCAAEESSYANQPSTCSNANWWGTLDSNNVWALCPNGYYLNGLYVTGRNLHNIEEGQCCKPVNQPAEYDGCYDEDVSASFDNKGWSTCQRAGYYMTGIWRGGCNEIYCIEKFKCCRMKKAAVNGGWTDFGDWGECSAACGDGQQERLRTCTNPPPSNGGAQCSGSNKETRDCNNGPCVVNGGWSDFGDWTECSAECGGGIQERARTCTNPPPSNGGDCCVGDNIESQICNHEPCVVEKVNGGWSEWSDYGECSKACGKGKKYKTRTCTNPPPSGGGKDCKGKSRKGKRCNNGKCE